VVDVELEVEFHVNRAGVQRDKKRSGLQRRLSWLLGGLLCHKFYSRHTLSSTRRSESWQGIGSHAAGCVFGRLRTRYFPSGSYARLSHSVKRPHSSQECGEQDYRFTLGAGSVPLPMRFPSLSKTWTSPDSRVIVPHPVRCDFVS
jgi:hypothetical protein